MKKSCLFSIAFLYIFSYLLKKAIISNAILFNGIKVLFFLGLQFLRKIAKVNGSTERVSLELPLVFKAFSEVAGP